MNQAFRELAAEDTAFVLGEEGEFAEPMVYTPRDDGQPRRITGVILRRDASDRPGMNHGGALSVVVIVPNHVTRGILASEIDNGDRIELKIDGVNDETRTISVKDQNGDALVTWNALRTRIVLV